jgi:hypothetical protein
MHEGSSALLAVPPWRRESRASGSDGS